MIVSIIIIYLLGCFTAYLIIGHYNDEADSYDFKFNILACLLSWVIPILIAINFLSTLEPSLKAFLQLFQKKEE